MTGRFLECALVLTGALLAATASPAKGASPTVYDLDIRLVPDAHRIEVGGTMDIAPQPEPTGTVRIHLSNRFHDFKVSQVLRDGRTVPVEISTDAKSPGDYILKLSNQPEPNRPTRFSFTYSGGEKNGFVLSMDGPTYYAAGSNTSWYPETGGEARGVGTLHFMVPPEFTVVASGKREGPEQAGTATFTVEMPMHLTFVAGRYVAIHLAGRIPVSIYTLRPRPGLDEYLRDFQRVIDGLAGMFGDYPYPTLALAEVPRAQANETGFDGVSAEGLIMMSDTSLDEPFSLSFFGHELGHQWWGNLVTLSGAKGNAILDEGLAQWGALRTVEQLEGEASALTYRRDGYPGNAWLQSGPGYLNIAAAGLDHPLELLPQAFVSHELANSKGFMVLDLLSRTVGRERFEKALQSLTREHPFGTITWEDFLKAVQKESGRDLDWFYKQWFERTGAPELFATWKQTGHSVTVTVRQASAAYRLNPAVRLTGANGRTQIESMLVSGPLTKKTFRVPFRVTRVEADPDYLILRWTPEFRSEARALAGVTKAYFLRSDGKADEAERAYREALLHAPRADRWGVRFRAHRGLASIAASRKQWTEDKSELVAALVEKTRPAAELPWVYLALATAAKNLHDRPLMESAVSKAVAADSILMVPTGAGRAARELLDSTS